MMTSDAFGHHWPHAAGVFGAIRRADDETLLQPTTRRYAGVRPRGNTRTESQPDQLHALISPRSLKRKFVELLRSDHELAWACHSLRDDPTAPKFAGICLPLHEHRIDRGRIA
jgi:hypothetical protein